MKTHNAIIIDDEQPAIDALQGLLTQFPEIKVAQTFNSAREALKYLLKIAEQT